MTAVNSSEKVGAGAQLHKWNFTANDNGDGVQGASSADRTVQVTGTMGGATITIEGRLDTSVDIWATLTDADGAAATFTAAGLVLLRENVVEIRPRCSGGSGHNIVVSLLTRKETK